MYVWYITLYIYTYYNINGISSPIDLPAPQGEERHALRDHLSLETGGGWMGKPKDEGFGDHRFPMKIVIWMDINGDSNGYKWWFWC